MSKSTEDLIKAMHLPPPPSQMNSDEAELAALAEQVHRAEMTEDAPPEAMQKTSTPLSALHANLESRILPFWSSVLPQRTVRLSLYASVDDISQEPNDGKNSREDQNNEPVIVQQISTAQDGSFMLTFIVPWERLCTHPRALHIAFGDPNHEHELFVFAELLAVPTPSTPRGQPQTVRLPMAPLPTVTSVTTPVLLSHSPVRK
jgi:hypothetical protein